MIEMFQKGGPLMWPLLAAALTGIAIAFERLVVFSRIPSSQKADKQLALVEEAMQRGGLEECAKVVAKGKGILNYIFAHLLKRYDTLVLEKKDLERARGKAAEITDPVAKYLSTTSQLSELRDELHITVDDATRNYVTRFLPALNTVTTISPLLGLCGTVTGMISAFGSIAASGTGDPRVVAAGIAEALITTATGLFIAIPSTVVHKYLSYRAEAARNVVEMYALAFSNTLLARLEKE